MVSDWLPSGKQLIMFAHDMTKFCDFALTLSNENVKKSVKKEKTNCAKPNKSARYYSSMIYA